MSREHDSNPLSENIFDYLRLLALDNFDPPVESKELKLNQKLSPGRRSALPRRHCDQWSALEIIQSN